MTFRDAFFERYLHVAPVALALERSVECEIMAQQAFERPILDVGCGDGIFASILFTEPVDTGIDPDATELERARKTGAYRELACCGGDRTGKPDGFYRTAMSNSVLEHIPDLEPVLVEVNRVLAPGGRFYVTIPTDQLERASLPARLLSGIGLGESARSYSAFHNRFWRHHHAYTPERWAAMFEKAGFEITKQQIYAPPAFTAAFELGLPTAAPSMVTRKLLKRWMLWPALRHGYASALARALDPLRRRLSAGPGGSLVFFALTKKA